MTAVYQPSLLEAQILPPRNQTPTSIAAAAQAIPHEGTQKMRILQLLADRGERGATMDEAEVQTGILKSACCGRFNRMADDGWITPINETRLTRWKRQAVVYVILPRGLAVLRGEGSCHPVDAKG
jgi:hypothetical protein